MQILTMNLLFLCIIFPTVLTINNNTDNSNFTRNEDITFENTTKSDTHKENQNTSIIKPIAQKNNNTTKHAKSKLQKKNANPLDPRDLKNEHRPVKPVPRDLPDMPQEADLEEITDSINKALDLLMENKNDIDISLSYGLFLLDVNLQTILRNKRNTLPSGISFNLKNILEKNDQLMKFFKNMVERDNDPDDALSKSLTTLFNHERLWISRLEKYDGALVNETVEEEFNKLEYQYSYWDKYRDNVGDFNKAIPRPDQSNRCLSYLANNHASKDSWKKRCKIPVQCKNPLEKGTDYGYGLTHRLLYLQLAYYGYRCHVFSEQKDKDMRQKFCKKMYAEATYISMNDYGVIDLFVEQLCLCALDGHFQFLHRSWLLSIISFQTDAGCFSDKSAEYRPRKPKYDIPLFRGWKLDKGENQYMLGGHCNVHTTSAAIATLGFGVKYILETYY
ncbi:uncharacterized protein LOC128670230 [Plodia interpunctella]|uniref:uncharacterized protein LOC128670230 n=1 Tax=Plodia interpunctella TaxID=58824 RepID=UPI002368A54A|nr:uncharacterized protein LOC128670230 [Plodia interpunctella]